MEEINLFSENIENPLEGKDEEIRKYVISLLENEGKKLGELNIILCNNEYILEINKTYLSHDYYTDIISFDFSEDTTISGDLYISVETVRSNSEEYKVTFNNELHRVIFHGILHFCGYNDLNDEQIVEMRAKEDYYLKINNL